MEEWKTITNYPDYMVSNMGRVWSKTRVVNRVYKNKTIGKTLQKGRFIKQRADNNGYIYVHLMKNKQGKNIKVHRLVALTFILNEENKEQVNHMDGNKENNTVKNLEWNTCKENMAHSWDTGLRKRGVGNGRAVLNEETVLEIRKKFETGNFTKSEIAREYGIGRSTLYSILDRVTWTHI